MNALKFKEVFQWQIQPVGLISQHDMEQETVKYKTKEKKGR